MTSKKWFIVKNYSLAIECELQEEDKYKKSDVKFYNIVDEPLGYVVTDNELYNSKEEAIDKLVELKNTEPLMVPISIDLWRRKRIRFLKQINGDDWNPPSYRNKKENIEWISM